MTAAEGSPVPGRDRRSFWERDEILRRAAERTLGREELALQRETLETIGAAAAGEIEDCAAEADRSPPTLVARDPAGHRIDAIRYHPAYRRLEDLAYREFRLVGAKYDPALRARGVAQRVGFLRTLGFGMAEQGVLCPVCMTDGVGRVLERSGDEELAREVVPRLGFGPGEPRATGAMFLTEKAGGSDVGRTETIARPDGELYRLDGEKWFCSNVDAEYVLALARPEGASGGTRGLGLFLVERAAQTAETFRIERLKDKLGTRSMPTGEVVLEGAPARLVGELSGGFKLMTVMLNLSRLYNAVVSCAVIGRSWLEARSFAERRITFGQRVVDHPLAREVLAGMEADYAGALALVLEATRALDGEDGGDAHSAALFRGLTPLIKLFTGKLAVSSASEGVEFLGGCGYVEDWPMARVLRDAQVLPIWEGTTNILSLDLVRVAAQGGLGPLFDRARRAVEASSAPGLAEARSAAARRLDEVEKRFEELVKSDVTYRARELAFALARSLEVALLLEAGEPEPEGPEAQAARRLSGPFRE